MKLLTKLTPIAATLLLSFGSVSAANADDGFQLSEKLSVTGFIDMSMLMTDTDGMDSDRTMGLDQFEMDFLYGFNDKMSAQVDLEYHDNGNGQEVHIEQAFMTYGITNEFSVKAGKFLSYSGWETEDPTGLFQYSGTGYAKYFYGGYQQGVSGLYSTDLFAVALSVINDLGDLTGENTDFNDPAIETMVAIMPTESITVKGFYSMDKLGDTGLDTTLINLWASYAAGPLTLAVEYNISENSPATGATTGNPIDATGFLLMGNYVMGDWGMTLRYHAYELENAAGVNTEEVSGITLSPSYKVNDYLSMIFEYRMDTVDVGGADTDYVALEALVTF
jgi:hypothetical protein